MLAIMGLLTINILMLYINLRLYCLINKCLIICINDIAIGICNGLEEHVKAPDLLRYVQPFRGVEDK